MQLLQRAWVASIAFLVCASGYADDWPAWRGPNRDGISHETGLAKQWPEAGPRIAWDNEGTGAGYSSLAVANGAVVTQGDVDGVEHILAFNEKDGSLLWAVQPGPVFQALNLRVEESFKRFDKNSDGKLDVLEAVEALGGDVSKADSVSDGDTQEIAQKRSDILFAAYDKNADKILTYLELHPQLRNSFDRIDQPSRDVDTDKLAADRAAAEFAIHDKNKDGKIDRNEPDDSLLRRSFGRADKQDPQTRKRDNVLTLDELTEYFAKRERGKDGTISGDELTGYFLRESAGKDGVLMKSDLNRMYGGYRNGMGDGPRGTPSIVDGRVYAEGGNGDLTCLDLKTGDTIWHINMMSDLKGGRPGWGYSESPLVSGKLVIVTPGGRDGTLAALNKDDGKLVWRSDNKQSAHYASPQLATIAGVEQLVQFSRESVFGVSLGDGKQLWSYKGAANGTANCTTPIVFGDFVLASSGYGTGTGLVKVSNSTDGQSGEEVYFQKRLANHHGGLVKLGDYVYGFGSGLMCMHAMTGEIVWQARSVGKGSLVAAGGMLYCLGERHEVALVEATPEEYREKGRFKIANNGRPAWAHPVVANGKLFIRNMQSLSAYDVSAK